MSAIRAKPMSETEAKGGKGASARILIGIATRNRANLLPKALASALSQSAVGVQVAVIDDASTDDTARLRIDFPQIDWTFRAAPQGCMSARNEFMGREVFDYFVSLDDDAWFLQGDELEIALAEFDKDPSLAAVAFDILSPDRTQARPRGAAQPAGMFIGCGHMLRLSAIRMVGHYAPTPGGYGGEEKDLCLRLIDAGRKIILLPGVHVWHDKTMVARDIASQHRSGVCNDLAMAVRRAPLALLPAIVAIKLARHLSYSWRAGLMTPCLSGLALMAGSLPLVWRWRKPVRLRTLRAYSTLSRQS
jgi:GT2 family glycosyltransferase